MIYIGIVGAESSMGKLVLEQMKKHNEMYRLCFKVDKIYQTSRQNSTFNDVEDALLMLTPTLVLDFGDSCTAYERGVIYQRYHVPAIMSVTNFDAEKIELLQSVRLAATTSPTLIIEHLCEEKIKTDLLPTLIEQCMS